MRIAVCCATERGRRVLEALFRLRPHDEFSVFSFREAAGEPPFLQSIQDLSNEHGASFSEASRLDADGLASIWNEQGIDAMFVVSWRYIIPMSVASKVQGGCFVLHDSLLPSYRGFAPTVWAIANGERETGATLFHLAEDVDSGDIIDQIRIEIGPDDMIDSVMGRVTNAYIKLLDRNLSRILEGTASRHPQDESQATYTCKRLPMDNEINWTDSTRQIHDLIRAVTHPYPGAYTQFRGVRMRIWDAEPAPQLDYVGRIAGRVVSIEKKKGVTVLTGDGQLLVKRVQLDGEPEKCASDLITGLRATLGP